eukprot:scaffold410_cov267-Chaetoceros_neogracile.AAC.39
MSRRIYKKYLPTQAIFYGRILNFRQEAKQIQLHVSIVVAAKSSNSDKSVQKPTKVMTVNHQG